MLMVTFATIAGMLLSSTLVLSATVRIGHTSVIGLDLPSVGQELFGGLSLTPIVASSKLIVNQGIPYAEAPIGNLRLHPPIPKFSLDAATFDATKFGLKCLQWPDTVSVNAHRRCILMPLTGSPSIQDVPSSEDCLTINVFRPAGISLGHTPLPVMAFIHGGGFTGKPCFFLLRTASDL